MKSGVINEDAMVRSSVLSRKFGDFSKGDPTFKNLHDSLIEHNHRESQLGPWILSAQPVRDMSF